MFTLKRAAGAAGKTTGIAYGRYSTCNRKAGNYSTAGVKIIGCPHL